MFFLSFQEANVLNINITSNSVEDKSDGQAEAQHTRSCDQLPRKRSIIISPKRRNSQSCRALHRISDHFKREGNFIGDWDVECSVMGRAARGLRDSVFGTAAEHESPQGRERMTRSSAICMCNKETLVQNSSPPSGQNSKTFEHNCKTQMDVPEHCSGVDMEMQGSPSMSSSIQSPSKSTTGSVMRFQDSTLEQFENKGSSVSKNEAEYEVTDISARELRTGAPSNIARQISMKTVAKIRYSSPVSVDCILSNSKEAFRQNLSPLSQYNSRTSIHSQRLQTCSSGSQSGANLPIKRSSTMSLLIQSPQKVYTGPVSASNMTLNRFEEDENSVVDCEDECEVFETAGRESGGSTSSTAAKCESAKMGLKRRNKSPLFVRSLLSINKEASRQECSPSSLHKSRISVQDQRIQMDASENQSVVDIPVKGQGRMSSLIYDAHPLVIFPDSVVKEWSTDRFRHVTNDVENLEMTNRLEEEEKNVTLSENIGISSERQNESVHMDVRTNGEHVNYPSMQALVKILESDDDSISFESDNENSQVGKMLAYSMCRPPTPGPSGRRKSSSTKCDRDPMTAYVKVEKLSGKKKGTMLKVCSKVKLKALSKQTQKPQRGSSKKQKMQSNQYR
jgi:hypothetical protein